ncbi:outer membrane protein assembly factor BamB [Haliea sp. AH-315-K21]|uniref:Outer membrane protein assembly factor BamB n=1 Tax=SAR86 cluster bacterium TaxID=2030880 RepID=A0A2A5CBJ6_9GAMM|nr:outer membrane protein assembly factor BamB [Haliea sp. AH-315-K21]PCJ41143.1 MAG: outer membrane protein assembly factor BamB [SAR86 cluster bacterium]
MKLFKCSLLIFVSAIVSACGVFGGDDEVELPAELVRVDEEVNFRRLWSANIGDGQGDKYNRLQPVIEGGVIYVAASNGIVQALNLEDGRRIWQSRLGYYISGGVGLGGDYLFLGTEDASLIALDKNSGETVWVRDASSEVLSVPASDGEYLIVQSADGRLTGYDANTGDQLWIYESTVPALSLRGTSSPIIINNFVLAGFENGDLVSVAIDNGTLSWNSRIAVPTGRSEIERIIDIDAELFIDGGSVLVPSYQGFLSMIDITTGQTLWRVEESSITGASTGFGNIYISDDRGHVKAYRGGGTQEETVWVNEQLDLREISKPVSFNNYIAVGDFEGYLHLLSQVDGRFVGRIRVGRKGLRIIQSQGGILYAYGNGGNLVAYQIEAK